MKEKIEIALLTYSDSVNVSFLRWIDFLRSKNNDPQHPRQYHVVYHPGWRPVALARNAAVEHFLKGDADRLLFIDDDIVPNDTSELIFENDQDIVSGIYYLLMMKDGNPMKQAAIYKKTNGGFESIDPSKIDTRNIDIDAAGTGTLLIKRKVFTEKMQLETKYESADGELMQVDMTPYFRTLYKPDGSESRSEDIDFVWRAKQLGFSCVADTKARFLHKKMMLLDWMI